MKIVIQRTTLETLNVFIIIKNLQNNPLNINRIQLPVKARRCARFQIHNNLILIFEKQLNSINLPYNIRINVCQKTT